MNDPPVGRIISLIDDDRVTPATARALRQRLAAPPATSQFFDSAERVLLGELAASLIPQHDRANTVDLVAEFDRLQMQGRGDGWRYAGQPRDSDMFRLGLRGLQDGAAIAYGRDFGQLTESECASLLGDLQAGRIDGSGWDSVDPARWFEELLAAFVDIYYSHPFALAEIGYAGFADARGWQDVGLGARAAHEPEAAASPEFEQ